MEYLHFAIKLERVSLLDMHLLYIIRIIPSCGNNSPPKNDEVQPFLCRKQMLCLLIIIIIIIITTLFIVDNTFGIQPIFNMVKQLNPGQPTSHSSAGLRSYLFATQTIIPNKKNKQNCNVLNNKRHLDLILENYVVHKGICNSYI